MCRISLPLLCLIATGCGSGALPFQLASVKGTVTYKGKPLEKGLIRFLPDTEVVDGQVAGKMAFSNISQGSYSIPAERGATVGKNRVEIVGYRETGKTTQVETAIIKEEVQFLPEKYNTSSTLSANITPGENTLDFDLE
ncbi:MAG: hypothetical protein C0478_14610 [Planctomyces sp.]|nr:hypothetical protein [Planctomyces sp.]